ncbi:MAG: NAD-dependent epimerase/dehydratase family protein [Lentisphaeria bacterium]|nr:NAD-dependent epimerase/dehydratase family protein [Lentisphaeria bacterium]NQZ71401.1 NAD-dependent epimerase/dehydratase family protein [Lentisphaeria bacterium]
MSRKVVVFGATGEIGGRIAKGCVDAGHSVIGVSRGTNTREMVDLNGVEMIQGNKRDESFMRDVAAKLDVDSVIDSVPSPESVIMMHKYMKQVENVFICSSTGTYVPLQALPADETHSWREDTGLNFHKQSVRDAHALDLYEQERFPITIFRPTNIIGPGRIPLELWGGRDIQFFKMLKAGEPVSIPQCEDVLLQPGYNTDLASAFVKALDFPNTVRGEIFNISCREPITLGRYLKTAMAHLNSNSEIHHVPAEELPHLYDGVTMAYGVEFLLQDMSYDIGKAEDILGYDPTHTAEQGLVEALDWCEATGIL